MAGLIPCICLGKSVSFRAFMENTAVFRAAGARTDLPKNRACLLIAFAARPEGDLRGKSATGRRSEESSNRFNKKEAQDAGQKQWRQTAHKIYKTPSLITFVKPKRH
jgi:hypothetical protein